MIDQNNIKQLAHELKHAQDTCTQIEPITSRYSEFSLSDAYLVSQLIHEMRLDEGYIPVGRKIGFTNKNMWSIYGVHEPIWAYIYDKTVTYTKTQQTLCDTRQYSEAKIEPEIIVHFASAPPTTPTPSELLACIDKIAHGFEIVQSHYPEWKFRAADTVADWSLHAELIIGNWLNINHSDQNLIEVLERFEVKLSCDSRICETGIGANVLGSPLNAVAHLLTLLGYQEGAVPIDAGDIVTTGTLTAACPVSTGQIWSAELSGISLEGMSVQIV